MPKDNMIKILTLLFLPVFVFGQTNDSIRLEKYLKAFLNANEFSGAVFIAKDNGPIFKKAFGFADLDNKILNTTDTKFRIASCSKQFTAIAILQLQEKGKLSVSDKLSKYFPNIAKSDSITIDMLLTHRAGIHNYNADSSYENINTPALTQKKVMEIIEKNTSDFSPGSKYQYSNGGFFILGAIIEKVSHQTYDEYIINNIFKKAKMFSSGIDHDNVTILDKAKGYINKNDTLKPAAYDNMEGTMGCGSLYSTVNDLYKYYLALNDTILLTKESRQQLITPKKGTYAYGIGVDTLDKHASVGHGGWVFGFTSQITMYLNDKSFFIVISNSEANVWGLSKGLEAVMFNVPVIFPYKYKAIKVETKSLEKYVGTYGKVKIIIKDNYLYLIDEANDDDIKLLPESKTKFFYEGENDRQIEFQLNKNNKVLNAWLIDSGLKHQLK